jgi:surface antigen
MNGLMHRIFSIFITTSVVLATILAPFHASALSGTDFKAGRIIDDAIFFKGDDMTADQVQQFLNDKVPTCDTNGTQQYNATMTRAQLGASRGNPAPFTCLKDYQTAVSAKAEDPGLCKEISGGTKTAAQIIQQVGASCGINQKVLLALLQREQGLVTDDWPFNSEYTTAMGYGCPDTAQCDSTYYGFFNQVYSAARAFKNYQAHPNLYKYSANANNTIQYNPNAQCGSGTVFIENQATAGLYNYSPYQPNTAALGNLYGTGDACSFYSNRNFWRVYNEWFGSTLAVAQKPAVALTVNGQTNTEVPYGSTVAVKWTSTNATTCSITPDTHAGTQGTFSVVEVTKPVTYQAVCYGAGDSARASASYTVSPPTFQYLRDYLTNAVMVSHTNTANLRSNILKLNNAEKQYKAGRKAQAQKTVEETILAVNKLSERNKLQSEYALHYTTAANALIASWTPVPIPPPAPTPMPIPVIVNGGYPSKWANAPQDSLIDDWGMYNRESVSYTAFKVSEHRTMPYWGGTNANQWDDMAIASGIPVDGTPVAGDVAIYNGGTYGNSMYVESVNSDGTINVSQYNSGYTGRYSTRANMAASNLVFIHFPY